MNAVNVGHASRDCSLRIFPWMKKPIRARYVCIYRVLDGRPKLLTPSLTRLPLPGTVRFTMHARAHVSLYICNFLCACPVPSPICNSDGLRPGAPTYPKILSRQMHCAAMSLQMGGRSPASLVGEMRRRSLRFAIKQYNGRIASTQRVAIVFFGGQTIRRALL